MQPRFDHQQIERYIKKSMVSIEIEIFEGRLREDPTLMAELKAYARIHELELPKRPILEEEKEQSNTPKPEKTIEKKVQIPIWLWLTLAIIITCLLYFFVAT